MPEFEYEFSEQDRDLVLSQDDATLTEEHYIRLTIYPTEAINNIVDLPDDTKGIDGKAIFFASLTTSEYPINISPFKNNNQLEMIFVGDNPSEGGTYQNDFKIYQNDTNGGIYIKPNEIFNTFELPQGDYRIQIDFLRQELSSKPFLIKQVSTSRREVRLKILDENITNISSVRDDLTNALTNNTGTFQFKHILNIGNGDHIPIMNFTFDRVTDGKDNQSIILKLYDALPTNIGNLSMVTFEQEILTTQLQDIFYFSDVPDVFFGDGLLPDGQENWINPDGNDVEFQNFDEISGSLSDVTLDGLISQSQYNYPNLNTDFTKFENHTFFGSAKKKLENFNTKVETIQGYYADLSSSLSDIGVSLDVGGDSTFVKQKRQDLFKKINDEIKTFTPYERFLYFDGQSESTSSAPGLGKNYAKTIPVKDFSQSLPGFDGFDNVYKYAYASTIAKDFSNHLYPVHEKPFFNYSSSVYLSFLIKGTDDLTFERKNENPTAAGFLNNGFFLPKSSHYTASVIEPSITGSEYRRFVFEASQSYFVPDTYTDDMAELEFSDFSTDSNFTILHNNVKTGSSPIKDSTGFYPTTVITQSGVPFKGSIMPAGDLFSIRFPNALNSQTQSFITDVKVTLNNPTKVQPFSNVYHTGSSNWTDWYNDMLTKAENFDTDNIHSFENNLPLYIQNSSEYDDMKDFLKLQGEQYDLIRNHIDSMGTIHKRGYKKTNSPPDNTLPMLLSNMGWEAINPFSGSLENTLGNYLTGVTTIDDIKNNTWRKTLNNLLYIYKSKGTKNSVRALLNTYGYPPDVLQIQEFGGSTSDSDNDFFDDEAPQGGRVDLSLSETTQHSSITTKTEKKYRYIFNADGDRTLNVDWWMDDANANTIQFIYKHTNTTQTQTILNSSGSGDETLWDLRLIPSSTGASSSFQFRLNNSLTGSSAIAGNAVSMSTSFLEFKDGQLWNVMLQRMTPSISGAGTQEYRLHSALQDDTSIQTYGYITMSISGGISLDSNHLANQNFQSSGSRHPLSSSNLFVGEAFSGSLSDIKAWSTPLSISKFRQHVLNKFSNVGNTINAHKDELIYHFKLNENYLSSSISASAQNLTIVDSSPTTTYSDYSFIIDGDLFKNSVIYGFDYVKSLRATLQDNFSKQNDNNLLINPRRNIVGNLSPVKSSVKPLHIENSKPLFKTSPKLELYRSPQTFVDNFILDNLSGYNLETLYGNPLNYYSQSYNEFDTFRNDFFDAHPIEVDVNKFIRAHESMFNHSIIEGVKSVVPARSTFSDRNSNFGVEIKPTVLEKQKYENEEHSIETNPNTLTGSINPVVSSPTSENIQSKNGSVSVNVTNTSTYELPKSGSVSVNVTNTSTYEQPKEGSILPLPTLSDSTVPTSKDGTIDDGLRLNKSFESIHKNWGTGTNDTYFINYFDDGGDNEYNTYHIDTRFVFNSIGDSEYYSASKGKASDFTDSKRFYNRLMIDTDFHSDVTYESLINGTVGGQSGRMMGKTRYFVTGSDGEFIFPSNHVTKFSNRFKDVMYLGTQNTNPGILNVRYEDYSSASFYRVKVTGGENQIKVQTGPSGLDGRNKIIYD